MAIGSGRYARDVSDDVTIQSDAHLLTITWTAPDRLNSLTEPMLTAAAEAIETVADDVRCIVIRGTGRAFGAGAALGDGFDGGGTLDAINRLVRAITGASVPVVAGVNGLAAGASVSVVLAADVAVVKRSAYFLLAFVNIGLMPDGGATELVAASIGRARAMSMAMLGQRLTADDAHAAGLVALVAEDDDFDTELTQFVDRLAAGPTVALGLMKQAVNATTLRTLDATLDRETEGQTSLFDTHDAVEGREAFTHKRTAQFEGR